MKRLSFLLLLASFAAPAAYADSIHKIQSSVQLTVNSAATQATRIGNSYSITGNNVTTSDGTWIVDSIGDATSSQSISG